MVQRLVTVNIDVRGNDIPDLHKHVVACGRNCTGSHGPIVSRRPGDDNGVAVRVAEQHGDQGIRTPGVAQSLRPEAKGKKAGKRPDGLDHGDEGPFVDVLAELGQAKESEDADGGGRNGEEISVELVYFGQRMSLVS